MYVYIRICIEERTAISLRVKSRTKWILEAAKRFKAI